MRSEHAAALVQLQHDLKDLRYDFEKMRDQVAALVLKQKARELRERERERMVVLDVSGKGQPALD